MKKRCAVFVGLMLVLVIPFLHGCEDYLDSTDIHYSLDVPDTAYVNVPVTIKGTIDQSLDIRVYVENYLDESLIGIITPSCDSIVWTPVKEGSTLIVTQVAYKSGRGKQTSLMAGVGSVYVKKEVGAQ